MTALAPTRPFAAGTRFAVLGFLLVSAAHYFFLSACGVWPLPNYSAYTNRQAEAFSRGQIHLVLRPAPGLVALADPYDPDANRPYRRGVGVHDTVLFDGKYYLYWGPVPALLLTAVKPLVGPMTVVGDEWLVLAFTLGTDLAATLLLHRLWRRCFPDRSPAVVLVGLLLFGLATPATYFLARPAVYEAAIVGGQCFLLFGLLAAWKVCDSGPSTRPEATNAPRWLTGVAMSATAGGCLALAVGCRVSLAVAVVAVAAVVTLTVFLTARRQTTPSTPWPRLAAFGLPLVLGTVALAGYNQARFGNPLEFGQRFQLTGANYRALPTLFSPANTLPGAWSYLARPLAVRTQFPFVRARVGEGTFPDWIVLPPHYETHETIAGLAVTAPAFLFALLPLALLWPQRCRRPERARLVTADPRFIALLLALAGGLGFAPILFMVGSTQRYLMDLWPAVAVLAAIGLWQLFPPGRRPTVAGRAVVVGLVAWTLALGVLLGFTGYFDHFRTWNRSLYRSLGGD